MSHFFLLSLLLLATLLATVNSVPLFDELAPRCPDEYGEHAYIHPNDCNSFFLCTNGTLSLERCENGLLFDGKGAVHNHCNYNWAVDCAGRPADLTPLSSSVCEYQFGIYPSAQACSTTYIKCAYGEPLEAYCDAGLVYNEKSHSCVWPDELLPYCNPEEIIGFKCPQHPPKGVNSKFWPYPRFPVPGDCGRLITCVNGYPRLLTCGDDKLFDKETLTCLDKDELPHCS